MSDNNVIHRPVEPAPEVVSELRRTAWRDGTIAIIAGVGLSVMAFFFDFLERFHEWSRARESWQIDEIMPSLFFIALALTWYAVRRHAHAVKELRARLVLQNELERQKAQLEILVDERTVELVKQNKSLSAEISERLLKEAELAASEAKYRLLFQNLPAAFSHSRVELDSDGKPIDFVYLDVNNAFERITGRKRESVIGRRASEVFPELAKQRPTWISDLCEVAMTGRPLHVESYMEPFQKWLGVTVFSPQPGELVSLALDMTEQRVAENELSANREMLQQAQKMEAVGRLAGGVAHDFNNILTVIMGHSEVLLADLKPEQSAHDDAKQILDASVRAASLTRQLLAFSRKQMLQLVPLNVNGIIENLQKMLSRMIGEDIEFRTKLDPSLGTIQADAGQLEQVIMNLVVNSRDAMPHGGELTIETANVTLDDTFVHDHPEIVPGQFVMVAVSDTGCGMDKTTQALIFEPFFTTKGKEQGTGLGLSTVYGIVRQSGGTIWVYSEIGKGTTFKIYLPLLEAEPGAVTREQRSSLIPGTETILLVEDDTTVRRITANLLRRSGHTVLESASGDEAIQLATNRSDIDLVVTDLVMPGMSGREVADRLKELLNDVPVLYMSGYTDDMAIRKQVLSSGSAFLQKPFSMEDLHEKVREALDRAPVSD